MLDEHIENVPPVESHETNVVNTDDMYDVSAHETNVVNTDDMYVMSPQHSIRTFSGLRNL